MSTRWIWRILDLLIGALFLFAGLTKIFNLDPVIADLRALQISNIFVDLKQIQFADPTQFARDIDNYKMLPWPVAVALALYLPWLEIFSGLALMTRKLYRGALFVLTGLMTVFIVASIIAKARGLDISCGCFGHASKGWSFGWHLALDFGILAALVILAVAQNRKSWARESRELHE